MSRRAARATFPPAREIIDVSGMTILPGLIDCHDHMANHRYDMAHRWRLDEPQSTKPSAHRRGAEADPRRRLYRDTRRRRARYRVQAGDRGRADRRAAADAVVVDHLADRRHRRRDQPIGSGARRLLLHPGDPLVPHSVVHQPRRCARCRAQDGAGRRRCHQMRDDRRRQLAPRPRPARPRLQPRRDARAGRRGAGA